MQAVLQLQVPVCVRVRLRLVQLLPQLLNCYSATDNVSQSHVPDTRQPILGRSATTTTDWGMCVRVCGVVGASTQASKNQPRARLFPNHIAHHPAPRRRLANGDPHADVIEKKAMLV